MNWRNVLNASRLSAVVALVAVVYTASPLVAQLEPVDAQVERLPSQEGVQVQTRGPVHEAFAEIVAFDPQPGTVVPKAPPQEIEELPPNQRPEGENIAWIPGYWAWDDERNDFLWVSGVWRALPPGRQWVPGYWGRAAQGFQWTSGYWADANVDEVEYLPAPPPTAEVGPNIAAPSQEHFLDSWLLGVEPKPLYVAARLLGTRHSRTGFGSLLITSVRLRGMSLSTDTKTTR